VLRTNEAGTLRAGHTGQTVTLAGWVARRRDHGGVAFLDLRDASGVVQVVARDEVLAEGGAHDVRNEYCVQVTGEVRERPAGNANPDLPTGEVEVVATAIDVLNSSAPLPFQIDERVTVGEEARLKYRYLDLRRPAPGAAIRLRSKVNAAARSVLDAHDFVEIETPTMTRSTPEGARDFIVPARLAPGSWYALPQSPQLFKQLLMVAGMERYYQIARCYRDEDFRADRQPEFTQLDIEMSFVEEDDVLAKQRGAPGLAYVLVGADSELAGPVAKNLTDAERTGLAAHVGAAPGDCIFFGAGAAKSSRALLGAVRLEIGKRCGLVEPGTWGFLWVNDAPLFEPASEAVAAGDVAVGAGAWTAVHHAFTSPKREFLDTFDTDPGSALAYAYDMVCNGNEIGGGSIRIHRRDVQERVFAMMGLSEEEAQEKFGFLLDAFAFGAPPHGGIAFGWDRICALLSGAESIREVIAFPKSGGGYDPLTGAPAPITAQQRKEAGVDAKPPA
jgi:aspartyl-tRNA synthetase